MSNPARSVSAFNDDTSWDYPAGRTPDQSFLTTRFIGAGQAMRRSVLEAIGSYDDCLFICGEELDLCYRMLNTGQRIAYTPEEAIRHALKAPISMCVAYRKSDEDKRAYKHRTETLKYIRIYEPNRSESVVRKFRRQFTSMPHKC